MHLRQRKCQTRERDEIKEGLSVRANAEIISQIQGKGRDLIVNYQNYGQITNWQNDRGVIQVMSWLLHTLPRRLPSP